MENKKGFFQKLLHNRSLRYGSNSLLLIAVVVAIAVVVNILVGMTDLKLDLTPNKIFSVGDTTKELLKGLNKDVTVIGLFDDEKVADKQITEMLTQYKKFANNGHITIQYKDPDKNPGFITELDPQNVKNLAKNDFVVKSGDKIKVVIPDDLYDYQQSQYGQSQVVGTKAEQVLTSAIKYVTADKTPTVYFTEGHGEANLDSQYSAAKQYIGMNNYEIKTLNLLTNDKIPGDAEILVVLSPKNDFTAEEAVRVSEYLKSGGKAYFMIDPVETTIQFTQLDKILNGYNLALDYDKIKENDNNRIYKGDRYSIVPDIKSNSLTSGLEGIQMLMPKTRSISLLKNDKEYITTNVLAEASKKAEGELVDKTKGSNLQGPLEVAVAVENKGGSGTSKIIVTGNSTFMSDMIFNNVTRNGMAFFLNSLSWMQDKKDDTMIAPKSFIPQKLEMTAAQSNISAAIVLVVFPLLILGFGTFVWLRRRHL